MTVIKGRLGAVYLATGAAVSMTDEATTPNTAKTVFTITGNTKRFLDPATAVTVKYNGSGTTAYSTLQRPGGVVTWAVSPGSSAVTLSGKYIPVAQLGYVRNWSMDAQYEFVDITCMGDTARVSAPTFLGATASVDRFYVDSGVFASMTGAAKLGLDLFMDATGGSQVRFTGYAYMASESIKAAVDGIIEEPLTFTLTDGPYFVAGL